MEARLAALEEWTRGVDVQGTVQRIQADSEAAIQGLLRQVSEREANVFAGLKSMQKQVEVLSTAVEVQAITKGLLEDMQTDLSAVKKAQAALREDVDRLQKRPENPGIATLRETLNKAMAEELLGVIDSQRRTHERLSAFEESHAALLPLHNAHETQLQMLSLKSDDMERRLAQAQEDLGHSERCHTAVEARLSELGTRAAAAPAQPAPRAQSPSQAPVNKMVLDTVDKLTSQQASLGDQLAESHSELLQALDRNQGTHAAALAAHATTLAQLEERASTLESNGAYAVDLTDRVVALEGVVAAGGEEGAAARARLAEVEASCETLAAAQSSAAGRQNELELLVVGTTDPAIIKLRQTVDETRREADAVVRRVEALEGSGGRSDEAAAGAAAQVVELGRRFGALDDSTAELTSAFNVLTRTAQAHDQRLGALEGAAPLPQQQQQQQQQQQHAEYTYVRSDAGGDAFEVVDAALGAPPTPPDVGSSDAAGDDGNLPPPPPPPQQQPQLLPHPTASVATALAAAVPPVPAREAPPPAAAAAVAYETVPVIPCSPPPKPPPPQQQQPQQEPAESSVSVPPPPPPSASPSAAHSAQYAASPTRTAFSAAHHRKSGSVAAASAASATTDRQELWRRQQVAARQASEAARADRRSPSPFEEAVLEGSRRQCSDARRELARTRAERRRAEDELDGVCAQMSKIQLTFKHLSAKQQSMDSDENLQSQLAQETHAPESAYLRGELGQVTEDITRAKHNILQKEKLLCAKTRELRSRVSGLRQSEHALLTELSTVEPLAGLARERSLSPHHGI